MTRRALLAAGAAAVVLAGGLVVASRDEPVDVVAVWFDQTARAVAAQGGVPDTVTTRTWALAWWAADRAAQTAPEPDLAVATAVHDVVAALVPERVRALDEALERTQDALPDDAASAATGRQEAAAVLAERAGDGLTVEQLNRPVVLPPPAPGVYRATGGLPAQAGQGDARPFLLSRAGEVDPGPPSFGSQEYERDLDELRRLGARDSAQRTQEQTQTARFWGPSLVGLLTPAVRTAVLPLGTVEAAALLGDLHRVLLDEQLAVYRAKYRYLLWRPVSAIGGGWTPLLDTPPHPEYPSGHTAYAAALAVVLEQRVGDVPFALTSAGQTRTYRRWQQVVDENVDARVWAGVHLRSSDVAGVDLGRRVAQLGLERLAP